METEMMKFISHVISLPEDQRLRALSDKYLNEVRLHLTNEEKLEGAKKWLE